MTVGDELTERGPYFNKADRGSNACITSRPQQVPEGTLPLKDGYWILDTGQEIFAIANAVQTPVSLLIVRKQIYIVCYIVSQINTITNIGVNVGRKKAQGSAHLECILGRYIADIWTIMVSSS